MRKAISRDRRNLWSRRAVAVVALAGIPLLALAIYLPLGSPQLPDFPLAERIQRSRCIATARQPRGAGRIAPGKNPPMAAAGPCWRRCSIELGRFDDAARAYRNAITYDGETAERRAELGEAIAGAANGMVTADAKKGIRAGGRAESPRR